MKKIIVLFSAIVFTLTLVGCSEKQNIETSYADTTISFHDKTFNKSDLSQETIEWLEKYNKLTETEQLSISYIPSDLRKLCGYDNADDAPAETNAD